jgi:hypothetical protein
VPLWLAVALKKRGKCTIRTPDWMTVDRLTQVLDAERESPKEFQPLPFHYIEISKLLFDHARDDISDAYLVRSLIEDIRDVRFHKVETGLETISGRTHAVKVYSLHTIATLSAACPGCSDCVEAIPCVIPFFYLLFVAFIFLINFFCSVCKL